jgi:3-oxoacyl-[acyl-carrier-protein] synthase II
LTIQENALMKPFNTETGHRRVVVTGMGAITPIGNSVPDFWQNLVAGTSGAAPICSFDASEYTTTFACEVKDFDPLNFLDKKALNRIDPFAQYALIAAGEALHDAGIDHGQLSDEQRARFGVVFGSGQGGLQTFQQQLRNFFEGGPRKVSPFFVPMTIVDMAPGLISMHYGLRGPNHSAISACATGNHNIADAMTIVQRGEADVMITGGSEASICEIGVAGFAAMRALSTRNESPESACRPFDTTRDGFVMGEGAGALVVESLEHAQQRGARIYAELLSVGSAADAHHMSAPHPEGLGAIDAMRRALTQAGLDATDVDTVNMHGTSTPLGDIAESKAIRAVFGEHADRLTPTSTKSMTGHLLGAAGAIEAIASILSAVHGIVPPTINFSEPDPECDLPYALNTAVHRPVNVAMSNAFGFGGHNSSAIFRRWE